MSKFHLFFGLCLLLVTFVSCTPKGILSMGEMEDVLYDLHLAETLTGGNGVSTPDQWRRGLSVDYFKDMAFQSVLRKHKITEKEFYASVRYYSKHLEEYAKIYSKVEDRLKKFETDIDNWKYMAPSVKEVLKTLNIDTLRSREFYYQYSREAMHGRFSELLTGATTYFGERNAYLWLQKRVEKKTISLIIQPDSLKKDTIAIPKVASSADSVPGHIINHLNVPEKIKKEVVINEVGKSQPNNSNETARNKEQLEQLKKKEMLEGAGNKKIIIRHVNNNIIR
jgi:hypothetical protein